MSKPKSGISERLGGANVGISNTMPAPIPLFLMMAAALFDNASHTEAIAARLADFGYTQQKLSDERSKIAEMSAAVAAHESASGAAQQATFEQNRAMEALGSWMSTFVKVAKVALREEPQLLERLGILKRNGKTAAQRKASSRTAATRAAKVYRVGILMTGKRPSIPEIIRWIRQA